MHKFKKIITVLIALSFILVIPVSAFASTKGQPYGAGEWDYVDWYEGELETSLYIASSGNRYKSYGGDFKIDVQDVKPNNCYKVQLKEYDPNSGDESIGNERTLCGEGEIVWNVRGAVDGGNGAELYLIYGYADEEDTVFFVGYD